MKILAMFGCFVLCVTTFSQTNSWHRIVPLHSSCADAKRLLGITRCETGTYDFGDERAFIWFSTKPCIDGWRVPPGTVTSVEVYPKTELRIVDLNMNMDSFSKQASSNNYDPDTYVNPDVGIVIAAYPNGMVKSIAHIPTSHDNYLRFPNSPIGAKNPTDPHTIRKFDEYHDFHFENERRHLDQLVVALTNEPNSHAFIVAYAGKRAHEAEAIERAERVKKYLVATRQVGSERIEMVNGGYRERAIIELFVGVKGTRPSLSPTLCQNEVKIISRRKRKGRQ